MPVLGKGKGLKIKDLKDVADGKRKLTPSEQEQFKKTIDSVKSTLSNFKLPELPSFMFNPLEDIKVSALNTRDYKAEANQKILTELMLEEIRTRRQQAQLKNPVFDFAKSEIHFAGQVIKISKGSNEYQVCRAVFSDPSKDWSWDEIVERWGENPEMKNWRVIYNASNQVNKKVAIETQVKDLLSVSTKTVSINPHYLKK